MGAVSMKRFASLSFTFLIILSVLGAIPIQAGSEEEPLTVSLYKFRRGMAWELEVYKDKIRESWTNPYIQLPWLPSVDNLTELFDDEVAATLFWNQRDLSVYSVCEWLSSLNDDVVFQYEGNETTHNIEALVPLYNVYYTSYLSWCLPYRALSFPTLTSYSNIGYNGMMTPTYTTLSNYPVGIAPIFQLMSIAEKYFGYQDGFSAVANSILSRAWSTSDPSTIRALLLYSLLAYTYFVLDPDVRNNTNYLVPIDDSLIITIYPKLLYTQAPDLEFYPLSYDPKEGVVGPYTYEFTTSSGDGLPLKDYVTLFYLYAGSGSLGDETYEVTVWIDGPAYLLEGRIDPDVSAFMPQGLDYVYTEPYLNYLLFRLAQFPERILLNEDYAEVLNQTMNKFPIPSLYRKYLGIDFYWIIAQGAPKKSVTRTFSLQNFADAMRDSTFFIYFDPEAPPGTKAKVNILIRKGGKTWLKTFEVVAGNEVFNIEETEYRNSFFHDYRGHLNEPIFTKYDYDSYDFYLGMLGSVESKISSQLIGYVYNAKRLEVTITHHTSMELFTTQSLTGPSGVYDVFGGLIPALTQEWDLKAVHEIVWGGVSPFPNFGAVPYAVPSFPSPLIPPPGAPNFDQMLDLIGYPTYPAIPPELFIQSHIYVSQYMKSLEELSVLENYSSVSENYFGEYSAPYLLNPWVYAYIQGSSPDTPYLKTMTTYVPVLIKSIELSGYTSMDPIPYLASDSSYSHTSKVSVSTYWVNIPGIATLNYVEPSGMFTQYVQSPYSFITFTQYPLIGKYSLTFLEPIIVKYIDYYEWGMPPLNLPFMVPPEVPTNGQGVHGVGFGIPSDLHIYDTIDWFPRNPYWVGVGTGYGVVPVYYQTAALINCKEPPGISLLDLDVDRKMANPGDEIGIRIIGIIDGEPAAGVPVKVSAYIDGKLFWENTTTLNQNGEVFKLLKLPDVNDIKNLTGIDLFEDPNATLNVFLVAITLSGKPLTDHEEISVGILTGVIGQVHTVDFNVITDVEPVEIPVPGMPNTPLFVLSQTMLTTVYLDPNLHPEGAERGDYYLTEYGFQRVLDHSIWDPETYLKQQLGPLVDVKVVFVNASDENDRVEVELEDAAFAQKLPPGDYRVFVEVIIGTGNMTKVFRTQEHQVHLEKGDIAVLDLYVPVMPIIRVSHLLEELREWKITNADLAYLIESAGDAVSFIRDELSALLNAYVGVCAEYGDVTWEASISDGQGVHLCEGIRSLKEQYDSVISSPESGDIRDLAVRLATVSATFEPEKIKEFLWTEFLSADHLPEYSTKAALSDPNNPWYKLFMLELMLSYLVNRKEHVRVQIIRAVKYISMLASLKVVDFIIKNRMFLIDKSVQSPIIEAIRSRLSSMGGLGSKLLEFAEKASSVNIILKATQIFMFTFVGETLNLAPTRELIMDTLKESGYSGIEIGYHIARFFKVGRFTVSTLARSLDTDVAFEIVFQTLNQVLAYLFLQVTLKGLDVVTNIYADRVLSGRSARSLDEAMIAFSSADSLVNGLEMTLELELQILMPVKNALRGIGGFLDYISGLKFIKGMANLDPKWAAKIGLTKEVLQKGNAEIAEVVYKSLPQLKTLSSIGTEMKNLGIRIAWTVVITATIDVIVLTPRFALLAGDYATKDVIYTDEFTTATINTIGTFLTNLLASKGINIIDFIWQRIQGIPKIPATTTRASTLGLEGAPEKAPADRPASAYAATLPASFGYLTGALTLIPSTMPTYESYWWEASEMAQIVSEIVEQVKEAGYVNMTALAQYSYLREELNKKLSLRYLIAEGKDPQSFTDADAAALSILLPYREFTEAFEVAVLQYGQAPEVGTSLIEYVANETLAILETVPLIDPPSGQPKEGIYSILLTAYDHRNGTIEIVLTPIGDAPHQVMLALSSDIAKLSANTININLNGETKVKVNYEIQPLTEAVVDISLVAQGEVIEHTTMGVSLLEDYVGPWQYEWGDVEIYSLGPINMQNQGSSTVTLTDIGTNMIALVTTQNLEITQQGSGTVYLAVNDYGTHKVYVITAENATAITIQVQQEAQQTQTTSTTTTPTETTTTTTTATSTTTTETTTETPTPTEAPEEPSISPTVVAAAAGGLTLVAIAIILAKKGLLLGGLT